MRRAGVQGLEPETHVQPITVFAPIRQRLMRFRSVDRDAIEQAWSDLLRWNQAFESCFPHPMKAPAVFADEDNVIEFEWHAGSAALIVRMVGAQEYEYIATDESDNGDYVDEGVADDSKLLSKLQWIHER